MDEQYYWIEIYFPFSGFWGADFKFWEIAKKIKEKVLNEKWIFDFNNPNKNRIRDSTQNTKIPY